MTRAPAQEFKLLPTDDISGFDRDRLSILRMSEDGAGYSEIAAALTIPAGTVKSRLFRIRKTIVARRTSSTGAAA